MPKSLSDRNELLKLYTGQTSTIGTAITPWIALYTANPSADGTGGTECADANYARQNASGKFAAPANGTVASNAAVTFPAFAQSRTITAVAIKDASSGGNTRAFQILGAPITVPAGGQARIQSGFIVGSES